MNLPVELFDLIVDIWTQTLFVPARCMNHISSERRAWKALRLSCKEMASLGLPMALMYAPAHVYVKHNFSNLLTELNFTSLEHQEMLAKRTESQVTTWIALRKIGWGSRYLIEYSPNRNDPENMSICDMTTAAHLAIFDATCRMLLVIGGRYISKITAFMNNKTRDALFRCFKCLIEYRIPVVASLVQNETVPLLIAANIGGDTNIHNHFIMTTRLTGTGAVYDLRTIFAQVLETSERIGRGRRLLVLKRELYQNSPIQAQTSIEEDVLRKAFFEMSYHGYPCSLKKFPSVLFECEFCKSFL